MGNNPRVFWKDGEYIEDTKENRQAIRITELEAQLAALTWTEITPENLPRVGDEVLWFDEEGSIVYEVTSMHVLFSAQKWRDERGMTHRRPINPPLPSGAKEQK